MFALLRRLARSADRGRKNEIEATLVGVDGFAGRGEVDVETRGDGAFAVEIELDGVSVAAMRGEVRVDGQTLCELDLAGGRARFEAFYRPGEAPVVFGPGRSVEVRLDGARALAGVFAEDR